MLDDYHTSLLYPDVRLTADACPLSAVACLVIYESACLGLHKLSLLAVAYDDDDVALGDFGKVLSQPINLAELCLFACRKRIDVDALAVCDEISHNLDCLGEGLKIGDPFSADCICVGVRLFVEVGEYAIDVEVVNLFSPVAKPISP